MFNLNRDEAVLLLGGVSSPILKRIKKRTILSFLPEPLISRYCPNTSERLKHISIKPQNSGSGVIGSFDDIDDPGLSSVLAMVVERRLHPFVQHIVPKMRRAALTISLSGLAYSILSSSSIFKAGRSHIKLAPILWTLAAVYVISLSSGDPDTQLGATIRRSKLRQLLRFIQSRLLGIEEYTGHPMTPSTDADSASGDTVIPKESIRQSRSIHWEIGMCSVPD